MATVAITLGSIAQRTYNDAPVYASVALGSQALASSGASQQSTVVSAAPDLIDKTFPVWSITASGGKVWVKFGANPTASAGDGWLILDGQTRDFGAAMTAEKVAVIDG
ncbi:MULTISPECIES: hypothetical protein [unclassified Mesorhizobium]|uniref:hypothetical protein n=1 Tax=unclassified Mesorhizobium TaxID=325217 RepID=UPI001126D348|nr:MULTISPECIES: hypothetical protein [unclassified Mesorhizobium]TPJ38194.1 hypothetical protein FJ437_30940 [Mesorhizobium sp. B2-6-6]MCA0000967.1 hypothetical protein [Mesorhizobium sp. B264B2A]MCA0004716.1 hypothetical protein [Mesorhizobium sp. B264B1B]MCA0019085.1 hypothetical protein [Mesorhizobium sp. B264B1A]TPJ56612.1 hypothetical protein FJ462_32675 [Mesorhizobium sp. B2-6-7]